MRLPLLPLLCLLGIVTASASPQYPAKGPAKGPGGPGKGGPGPKGYGSPPKGPGGPPGKQPGGAAAEPPLEQYIYRIIGSLTLLDNSLKSVPPGGSVEDAQRITYDLSNIQGTIVSDLREGARQIRAWPSASLYQAPSVSSSLTAAGQKLTSAMRGWLRQKDMVEASGNKSNIVGQLESLAGALSVFYDDVYAKIGARYQSLVTAGKNAAREDVESVIFAFRR
jgi:hypothetical protein